MTKTRAYAFTQHDVSKKPEFKDTMKYMIYQLETAPETKKQHFQGYVYYNSPREMKTPMTDFPGAHIEKAHGSPAQNKEYCSKEESREEGPFEHGTLPTQGKRNDLISVYASLKEGKTLAEVAETNPEEYIKFHAGIGRAKFLIDEQKASVIRNVRVEVYWGDTGTGKTWKAYHQNPADTYKWTPSMPMWFDGYTGQGTLLMDEFANQIPITKLLNLLDIYPLRLDIKNSFTWARWHTVYITSNLDPREQWYPEVKEKFPVHFQALERRLTKITHFTAPLTTLAETATTAMSSSSMEVPKKKTMVRTARNRCLMEKANKKKKTWTGPQPRDTAQDWDGELPGNQQEYFQ